MNRALCVAVTWAALSLEFIGCSKEPADTAGGGGFTMPPTVVEVAKVQRTELVDRFEAVGSFDAIHSLSIVSEVNGTVRELLFKEGEPVAKGDLLVRLNDSELSAILSRTKALLEQTRIRHDRIHAVVEQKAGAPQDLDDASSALKVAEADVALAQARLDKTRIRAPFAGHIGPRLVSIGAFIQPGKPITTLTQLSELEVVCAAAERYLPLLRVGASISVSTPAYPNETVDGKLTIINPIIDSQTRTIEIFGRVPNPGLRFRPGMSADIVAVLRTRQNALTIPSAAIFAEGVQMIVYKVAADSTVQRTPVTLGTRLAAKVEILNGLVEGDLVVQAGHQKLFPGAKVMPIIREVSEDSSL